MIFGEYKLKPNETLENASKSIYGFPQTKELGVLNGNVKSGDTIKYEVEETKTVGETEIITTGDIKTFRLVIGDKIVENIIGYELKESLTEIKTLTINLKYDNNDFVNSLKYGKAVYFYENGEKVFTGFIKATPKTRTNELKMMTIVCKSKAGLLIDSHFPLSSYPIEFNNLSFRQIVSRVAAIKAVKVNFQQGNELLIDSTYSNDFGNGVSAKIDESIMGFIVRLAHSKGLIVTDDENGNLYIFKKKETKEPFIIEEDKFNGLANVKEELNLDSLAEEYTIFSQYKDNSGFGQARIKDFPLPISKTKVLENNTSDNLNDIAKWWLCRELGNAIKYRITIPNAVINDRKIKTGDDITLKVPSMNIDKNLVIESIKRTVLKSQVINLTLTIPNAYNGNIPSIGDILWSVLKY